LAQGKLYEKRLAESEALFSFEQSLYRHAAEDAKCAEGAKHAAERDAASPKVYLVAGIDEVGRGALAGPVTAAAVVLGADWLPEFAPGLRDSKKLTAKRRAELAGQLEASALAHSVAHVDAHFIDDYGIMPALHRAMLQAVEGLDLAGAASAVGGGAGSGAAGAGAGPAGAGLDKILIDGNPVRLFEQEEAIVKGDAKVACIAAASILAKYARDTLMLAYDEDFPGYDFGSNKGYSSERHQKAIRGKGLSPIHRKTFCQNFFQGSLF